MKGEIKKSDKRRLIWQSVLIIVITFSIVSILIFLGRGSFRELRKMAVDQFNRQQLILARSAANGIDAYLQGIVAELSSLTNLPEVQLMTHECLKYMQHAYYGSPLRTSIRRLDSSGILRMIYPFESWRGEVNGRDYSYEIFFQEAKEKGRIGIRRVINEQGEVRIRIAVPIYLTHTQKTVKVGDETGIIVTTIDPKRSESGRFQGVLIGSINPQIIARNIILPIVSGKTGYAWLLNEDGIFLAHHEIEFIGRNAFEVRDERNPNISYEAIEQIQRRMIAGEEGTGSYIAGWHRGEKGAIEKLVAYTPVHFDGNTWSVAVCAPVSEVKEIIYRSKHSVLYTLGFVIIVLIAGGLLFFLLIYRWSHSLELEVVNRTKELRETGEYLNNLIRYASAPIIVWGPEFRITHFNRAFEHLTGYKAEDVISQGLSMFFPESSRDESLSRIERTLRGEYWESVEIPILCKDGEIRVALWNSANIYAEDGTTLLATIAQGIDITERKKREEALRNSEEKYRSLFENMLSGFAYCKILVDEDNQPIDYVHLEVNDAWERLVGLKREDVVGKKVTEAIPGIKESETDLIGIYGKVALTCEEVKFDLYFELLGK